MAQPTVYLPEEESSDSGIIKKKDFVLPSGVAKGGSDSDGGEGGETGKKNTNRGDLNKQTDKKNIIEDNLRGNATDMGETKTVGDPGADKKDEKTDNGGADVATNPADNQLRGMVRRLGGKIFSRFGDGGSRVPRADSSADNLVKFLPTKESFVQKRDEDDKKKAKKEDGGGGEKRQDNTKEAPHRISGVLSPETESKMSDDKDVMKETEGGKRAETLKRKEKTEGEKEGGGASDTSLIPVLRTFQGDSADVAYSRGGVEMRKVLAVEMEKKKKEQEEYLRETKELLKEAAILKEKQRGAARRQKNAASGVKAQSDQPADEDGETEERQKTNDERKMRRKIDNEQMTNTMVGALNYAKRANQGAVAVLKERPPAVPQPRADVKEAEAVRRAAKKVHHGTIDQLKRMKQDAPAPAVRAEAPAKAGADTPPVDLGGKMQFSQFQDKPPGFIGKLRNSIKLKKDVSQEQRNILRQKQKEAVEKEEMRKAWQSFETKKEQLRESGLRARDVRSYSAKATPNKALRRQNFIAIFLVLLILITLVVVVVYILTKPNEAPIANAPREDVRPVSDVVTSESQVSVAVLSTPKEWGRITQSSGSTHTISKFIPYEVVDGSSVQFDLNSFFSVFNMPVPDGLKKSLGNYYFVGSYTTDTTVNGIFIVTVKNYGDALSWMLSWENSAVNAFADVFPNTLLKSNPGNTQVRTKIIDNKDVRILTNARSSAQLLYYFFNRSVLVFIVGEEDAVRQINNRIRSANA